jgi:hypothetical protein
MDLIEKLDMNKDIYLNRPQRQGGTNLYLVCNETRHLVNEWYELGCDYHNIDDSPSVLKNIDGFIDHRHDQSVLSLILKKYSFEPEGLLTPYPRNKFRANFTALRSPIWAARNKSGISHIPRYIRVLARLLP